jgi:hypothetical protein
VKKVLEEEKWLSRQRSLRSLDDVIDRRICQFKEEVKVHKSKGRTLFVVFYV